MIKQNYFIRLNVMAATVGFLVAASMELEVCGLYFGRGMWVMATILYILAVFVTIFMGRRGLNRSWWFLGGSVLWPIYWRIFQYGMACINSVTFFASEEVWRQFRNPAMGLIIMFELMIMVVVEFMVMLVSCVVRGCQKQNKGV